MFRFVAEGSVRRQTESAGEFGADAAGTPPRMMIAHLHDPHSRSTGIWLPVPVASGTGLQSRARRPCPRHGSHGGERSPEGHVRGVGYPAPGGNGGCDRDSAWSAGRETWTRPRLGFGESGPWNPMSGGDAQASGTTELTHGAEHGDTLPGISRVRPPQDRSPAPEPKRRRLRAPWHPASRSSPGTPSDAPGRSWP